MRLRIALLLLLLPLMAVGQPSPTVKLNTQVNFDAFLPTGNYSGLTALGSDRYAVVSDKSSTDGFYIFHITIDSITGQIRRAENEGFRSSGRANRDIEGIALQPSSGSIWISGEADNAIREYRMDGTLTGQSLDLPKEILTATPNYGLEALTYDTLSHSFFTCTESTLPMDGQQATATNGVRNRLRIVQISDSGAIIQYAYLMDAPQAHKAAAVYAMGVSELLAMPDGSVLVLEREAWVPKKKVGAWVENKVYQVFPRSADILAPGQTLTAESHYMPKTLLAQWRTNINLTRRSFANYEGMALGPRLADGSQVVIFIADSQNRYAGFLRDWMRTMIIKN